MRKHNVKKVSKDFLDEGTFGSSQEPYYIGYQMIEMNHKIDTTLTNRIFANPKVLNAKAPLVQASHWGIYDVDKQEVIHGKLMDTRREVASVTKIMTCYAVIEIARKYALDLTKIHIKVCKTGSRIIGSSAKLREGDILTAEQLLYGLMLPSGNDAGFCLAKHFGKFLFEKKGYTEYHKTRIRSFEFDFHGSYVKYFLKEMNEQASALKMRNTHWDSPHGLANQENLTTVSDMFRISEKAIQVKLLA